MRGMPGLLKKARELGASAHRVVDSRWGTIAQHVPSQRELLRAEGVRVCDTTGRVLDEGTAAWAPTHEELYLCEPTS